MHILILAYLLIQLNTELWVDHTSVSLFLARSFFDPLNLNLFRTSCIDYYENSEQYNMVILLQNFSPMCFKY